MISPRKRKAMLVRLNNFFTIRGEVISKEEYRRAAGTPYRMDQIDKHLHGWDRMLQALRRYFPKWADSYVEKAEPAINVTIETDEKVDDMVEKLKASAKAAKAEAKDDE